LYVYEFFFTGIIRFGLHLRLLLFKKLRGYWQNRMAFLRR